MIEKYIMFVLHNNQVSFVANTADILAICYSENPTLPSTQDIRQAKFYNTIDEVKCDIQLLRYHHREFLTVPIYVKKVHVNPLYLT